MAVAGAVAVAVAVAVGACTDHLVDGGHELLALGVPVSEEVDRRGTISDLSFELVLVRQLDRRRH